MSARLVDLVGDRLPEGSSLRDLGSHWLKDLDQPEHLLQVDVEGLPHDFPPLKSLTAPDERAAERDRARRAAPREARPAVS